MYRLMILITIALVFCALIIGKAQGQDFIQGKGGVTANLSQLEKGKVSGASEICFLKKAFKNVYLSVSYLNQSSDWENYSGKILWFTSAPDPTRINLYLLTSGGYTHSGLNEIDAGSLGIGFGSVFAVKGFNPLLEVAFYQIDGDWTSYINAGLQIGLSF